MDRAKEKEFNAIADLPNLKPADMQRFDNLYVRWEAEMKKHEAISREYYIGITILVYGEKVKSK